MKPPYVLLVGAGQLGSRYLQGLAKIDKKLRIMVVDLSSDSIDIARKRYQEIKPLSLHEINFSTSFDQVSDEIDLAILATPANCRHEVVQLLRDSRSVKAWVLEKVLAQSIQQLDMIESYLDDQQHVWVNTPRRLMTWHQSIKEHIFSQPSTNLHVLINGGDWGLACNAIHFIDLVSWWTGASVKDVDNQGLEVWKPSKRRGFYEVFGSLMISFHDGSTLGLVSGQNSSPIKMQIETQTGNWLIDENNGKAVGPFDQVIGGKLEFQSALTAPLVDEILSLGRCGLTKLPDSVSQHRPFLDAMLYHWNQSQSRHDLAVPIT